VEGQLERLEDRVRPLESEVHKLQIDLSETIHVLNEATKAINELQRSQQSLEERVEDNTLSIKRDVQALNAAVHNFGRQFIEMNGITNDRLTAHERMPSDQAHFRPHSAA
jgi:chromosome segregation ATPase